MTSRPGKVPRIRELTDDDVLLGRGFPAIENEGNVRFRELVRSRSAEYHAAYRRHTKDSIAREVVNTILARSGRFLTQLDAAPNIKGLVTPAGARVWVDADEAVVLIKAKQALRDHADDSKEARPNTRRRPAAGSGNVVLEWITPPPSPAPVAQPEPQGNPNVAAGAVAAATGAETSAALGLAIPGISLGTSSTAMQPQALLATLLASQPQLLTLLGQLLAGSGGMARRASEPVAFAPAPTAASAAPAPVNPQGSSAITTATLQAVLQQILTNQGNVATSETTVTGTFGGTTTDSSLALLQQLLGTQPSAPVLDLTSYHSSATSQSSSQSAQRLPGSSMSSSTSRIPQLTGGSNAIIALNRGIDKASNAPEAAAATPLHGDAVRLCGLEASLLKVLCSFGFPLWSQENRETAFGATDELPSQEDNGAVLTWTDLGKHLVAECQSTASTMATVTAAESLSNDPTTLAKVVSFLTRRCVDCTKGVAAAATPPATTAATAATTAASIAGEGTTGVATMKAALTEGDNVIVEHAATQWSVEVTDCSALDGTFVVGSIPETLTMSLEDEVTTPDKEKQRASSRSTVLVSAVLDARECQTIVETLATLLQLRWIFQNHPMATIYTLLSAQQQQGAETSRDYLLLKGALAHGLTNELEFRVQQGGSNMTHSEVEDRICLLTRLLFKHLHEIKKKEAAVSLQRRYSVLMSL